MSRGRERRRRGTTAKVRREREARRRDQLFGVAGSVHSGNFGRGRRRRLGRRRRIVIFIVHMLLLLCASAWGRRWRGRWSCLWFWFSHSSSAEGRRCGRGTNGRRSRSIGSALTCAMRVSCCCCGRCCYVTRTVARVARAAPRRPSAPYAHFFFLFFFLHSFLVLFIILIHLLFSNFIIFLIGMYQVA